MHHKINTPHVQKFFERKTTLFVALFFVLVIVLFISLAYFSTVLSATYTWTQTDWSGGATANTAVHPGDQSGWSEYTGQAEIFAEGSLSFYPTSSSTTETTDANFLSGSFSNATTTGDGSIIPIILVEGNTWQTLATVPGLHYQEGPGAGIQCDSQGEYVWLAHAESFSSNGLRRYSIENNTWSDVLASCNSGRHWYGGGLGVTDDYIYFTRGYEDTTFCAYPLNGNPPKTPTSSPIGFSRWGDMLYPGFGDYLFTYQGDTNFRAYSISNDSWSTFIPAIGPDANVAGGLEYPGFGDYIYWINSGVFRAYSLSLDSWDVFDPPDYTESVYNRGYGLAVSGDYMYTPGYETLCRYSLSQNSWETLSTLPETPKTSGGPSLAACGRYVFYIPGTSGTNFYRYTAENMHATSSTFISQPYDAGEPVDFTTLDFNALVPASTTLSFQLRSADTEGNLSSATWYGPTGTSDHYTNSGESFNSIHDGNQWFQYKAFFTTTDTATTSILHETIINYSSYATSSTLTSSPYDTTDHTNLLAGISWTETLADNTDVVFQIRTAPDAGGIPGSWTQWYGPTGTSTYFTDPTGGEPLPSEISDGVDDQWIQYKVYLTGDGVHTPVVEDVTLSYVVNATPNVENVLNDPSGALDQNADGAIDLVYEVSDADNTTGEVYFFYDIGVTLSDEGGILSSVDTTDVIVSDSSTFPPSGMILIDNEVIAYTSNDTGTATLSGLTRGEWPGEESWSTAGAEHENGAVVYLLAETTTGVGSKTIGVASSTFSGTLSPVGDVPGVYLTDATIAIAVNDGELGNMIDVATSSSFVLDTKGPMGGSILHDSNGDMLTIRINDDSPVAMKISNNSNLSSDGLNGDSGVWVAYGTDGNVDGYGDTPLAGSVTKSWIGTGDAIESVYVQFKDYKGNLSPIYSVDTPRVPGNVIYQDVTNLVTEDYKLFVAWGVVPLPASGFQDYKVYRSEGGAYSLFKTITDREENYLIDSPVASTTEYSYKIYTTDTDGNTSEYSSTVTDVPDGQGGSDLTPPTITNVSAVNLVPQGVEISWTTDELANSTVGFSEDTSYSNEQGSPTMTTDHSVILSDLTPNTTYYYRVRSDDPTGNASNWSNGYQFTTPPGPAISNVTVPEITSATAKISWITDIPADSFVVYSNNANMASSSEIGTTVLTTNHSITLSGLTEGETYYYYVKSTDESMNESTDTKAGEYYMFVTTIDNTGPVISNVTVATVSDTQATVTWTTDENSTSQIFYGTDVSYGASSTLDSTLSIRHSVTLTGLTKETDYLFKVASNDVGGNASEDDNNGSGYAFTTTDEPGITQIIESDPPTVMTDTTPPNATNLQITNIGSTTATISWFTSEQGNSLVVYGHTTNYGFLDGDIDVSTSNHSVTLQRLEPARLHHFKTVSIDDAGNVGSSEQNSFTTLDKDGKEVEDAPPPTTETDDENEEIVDPEEVELPGLDEEMADAQNIVLSTIDQASEAFITAMLKALPANPNISNIPEAAFVDSVAEIAPKIVSPPEIASQDLTVEVGPDWAEFTWITNKRSSGLVSVAHEDDFDGTYTKTEGNADTLITNHRVRIDGLESQSVYHYSVQSKGQLGDWARSPDATFTTTSLLFEIIDFSFDQISTTDAAISWETTLPTRSTIEVTDTATGEIFTYEDDSFLREHTFKIDGLALSTSYVAQVIAEDEDSNISSSSVLPFTTQASLDPAVINQVRTTTALVPGQIERVQTIISWKTDKPATSRVLFEEGVSPSSELAQSTQLQTNLTKDHVVVTTQFKPGRVYRFRIESIDGIGNRSVSKDYTILTPAPEENVLDLILDNFEDNFEFLKRMRF